MVKKNSNFTFPIFFMENPNVSTPPFIKAFIWIQFAQNIQDRSSVWGVPGQKNDR